MTDIPFREGGGDQIIGRPIPTYRQHRSWSAEYTAWRARHDELQKQLSSYVTVIDHITDAQSALIALGTGADPHLTASIQRWRWQHGLVNETYQSHRKVEPPMFGAEELL